MATGPGWWLGGVALDSSEKHNRLIHALPHRTLNARGAGWCSIALAASVWTMAPYSAPMRRCLAPQDGRLHGQRRPAGLAADKAFAIGEDSMHD
jgi:hypothetical protein